MHLEASRLIRGSLVCVKLETTRVKHLSCSRPAAARFLVENREMELGRRTTFSPRLSSEVFK